MIEVGRRPYAYSTSHRLDVVEVVLQDGTRRELLRKDLRWSELHAGALAAKPAFLHDRRREIDAYRLLAGEGLGTPTCYESEDEDCLLLERVAGVELWQVGELETWVAAARWLARLHSRFASSPPKAGSLLRYDAAYFSLWLSRALRAQPSLAPHLAGYERVIGILCGSPPTLVHGEFYASNILAAGTRIAAVDWEMAGIGPGVLDLAALVSGWGSAERAAIVAGYGDTPPSALDAAELHLALQWLGWSPDWTPPPEHGRDWLLVARQAAERMGLGR